MRSVSSMLQNKFWCSFFFIQIFQLHFLLRSQTAAININKQKKTFVKYPLHKLANFFLFKTWLFDFVFFFKNKSRIDAEVVLQLLVILVCSKTDGFLFENIAFCNLGQGGNWENLQNVKKKTHQRLQICNEKQGFEIKKLANFYCFQKCEA